MSRRFLAVVCVVAATVLVLGFLPGSALAGPDQAVLLMLKGKPLETAGELTTGTTFVPVEALSADLGFKVNTVRTGQLIVTYGDKKVVFTSGTTQVVVNGHEAWCIQYSKDGSLMVPVRFLLENMGFRVGWSSDPQNTVDLYPVQENNVVIGTVRERQETAGLSLDIQYPKLRGLESAAIQDAANAFFAGRSEGAIARGYQSVKVAGE